MRNAVHIRNGANMTQTKLSYGPKRYTQWMRDEKGKRVWTSSKRNFYQRIDKIEQFSHESLKRYRSMFREWLNVADLIVLQRLEVQL